MTLKSEKGFGLVWIIVLVAVIAVAVGGYFLYQSNSDDSDSASNQENSVEQEPENESEQQPEKNPEPEPAKTGTVIASGDSQFGPMLFNADRQAIYIWEVEESKKAECYGDCAKAWPPVLTDGAPQAKGSVKSSLLGTTKRTDGSTQVTYNGHPLYYYAHEGPGEVECHNISTHGGLWWVIKPSGVRAE